MTSTSPEQQAAASPRRPVWQRLLGLVIPLLVLIGVDRLYPVAAAAHIVSGPPGELLYAAGFDGFTDEWQQQSGRDSMQIVDGKMRLSVQTSRTIYSAAAPEFRDFDARVTATAVDGPLNNEGFGLVFRLQEQTGQCNMPLLVLCDLSQIDVLRVPLRLLFPRQDTRPSEYYIFLISNDGYYSLWRGNAQAGTAEKVTVWHNSEGLIRTGLDVENEIRVVARGSQFSFYINGEQVELCIPLEGQQPTGSASDCMGEVTRVWEDDRFPYGKLGVVVNTNRFPGTVVDFDNFVVFSPEAPADDTTEDQA